MYAELDLIWQTKVAQNPEHDIQGSLVCTREMQLGFEMKIWKCEMTRELFAFSTIKVVYLSLVYWVESVNLSFILHDI